MCDLYCGRGGWTAGFKERGWYTIGIDLAPQPEYPGDEFMQADIAQLTSLPAADFYCCSSPCDNFSVHCMKNFHKAPPWPLLGICLFEATRDLLAATGKPYVMENVRCAEGFVGRSVNHFGSFYLWGTGVPAIMPRELRSLRKGCTWRRRDGRYGNGAVDELMYKSKPLRAALLAQIPHELASEVARVWT